MEAKMIMSSAEPSQELMYYSDLFADVVSSIGQDNFAEKLTTTLKQLVVCDEIVFTLFADRPQILYFEQKVKPFPQDFDTYLAGAFLIDPYYRAAREHQISGFASFVDLAPEGFVDSEYYQQYLIRTGLIDECGYLIHFESGHFLNLSLDRSKTYQTFSEQELDILSQVSSLVEALCIKHWSKQVSQMAAGTKTLSFQLDEALECFGGSKLTPREAEIIRLLLKGHSSNSIAERLDISSETVRIHRRNSYRKLDIGSQSELFHLFIDSLKQFENYDGGDPLENYF
ncbi:helix-turn-helix transcriptional regulator [Vibrio sp.]|uniref:helix-turn-helix transcriptional regulator n=1 Tax=Vibrio sp. TaxID=678 RepID=UPI003D0EF484